MIALEGEEGFADISKNNFDIYDLSDIFPFLLIDVKEGETLEDFILRSNIDKTNLTKLNKISESGVLDNKVIIINKINNTEDIARSIQSSDIKFININELLSKLDFPCFLVSYCTSRGFAFGKLTLTAFEIIFEPFNPKLMGFVNQES